MCYKSECKSPLPLKTVRILFSKYAQVLSQNSFCISAIIKSAQYVFMCVYCSLNWSVVAIASFSRAIQCNMQLAQHAFVLVLFASTCDGNTYPSCPNKIFQLRNYGAGGKLKHKGEKTQS